MNRESVIRCCKKRCMRASSRSKTEGTVTKLGLPNRLEYLTEPILYDPILEGRNPQGTTAAVGFGDVDPPHRLGTIPQPTQARG